MKSYMLQYEIVRHLKSIHPTMKEGRSFERFSKQENDYIYSQGHKRLNNSKKLAPYLGFRNKSDIRTASTGANHPKRLLIKQPETRKRARTGEKL